LVINAVLEIQAELDGAVVSTLAFAVASTIPNDVPATLVKTVTNVEPVAGAFGGTRILVTLSEFRS